MLSKYQLIEYNFSLELVIYQKIKVKASNSTTFPFLMLPNVAFDALEWHFWCFTIGSKHQNGLIWKTNTLTPKLDVRRLDEGNLDISFDSLYARGSAV